MGPTLGNKYPIFEGNLNCSGVQFTSGDGFTKKTIFLAANFGSRIDYISLCSNDPAGVTMNFYKNDGVTDRYYGFVTIASGAGYTQAKQDAVRTLSPILGFIPMPSGWSLKCSCNAIMTNLKTGDIIAEGGDF